MMEKQVQLLPLVSGVACVGQQMKFKKHSFIPFVTILACEKCHTYFDSVITMSFRQFEYLFDNRSIRAPCNC
jgi:hypothetical protein